MIFVEVRNSWGCCFFGGGESWAGGGGGGWGGGGVNYVMPFVIDKTHYLLNWFVSVYVLYGMGINCVSL